MSTIFNYNNANITFKTNNGEVFVNATEMAKSFGTKPDDWLRTEPAKKMIGAIAESHICASADLVRVTKGGDNKSEQGTWMHEDVALVFAQWLSPEFYLWCNNHIKQLIKQGYTTTVSNDDLVSRMEAMEAQMATLIASSMPMAQQPTPTILLTDWQWAGEVNMERVFLYLLSRACKHDSMVRGVELKRGQVMVTLQKLSKALDISIQLGRTALKKMVLSKEITIATNNKCHIITVLEFDRYVGETVKN